MAALGEVAEALVAGQDGGDILLVDLGGARRRLVVSIDDDDIERIVPFRGDLDAFGGDFIDRLLFGEDVETRVVTANGKPFGGRS
jgi:hypothetical protein